MDKQARAAGALQPGEHRFACLNGFNGSTMRMVGWPIEAWLRWQAEVLDAVAPVASEWLARRREGTASALRAIERLRNCADVADCAKIQSDWAQEASKRLVADFRSLTNSAWLWRQASAKAGHGALTADESVS